MNNDRRKRIEAQIEKLNELKATAESLADDINGVKDEVESLRDEEQEYHDNMPESLQGGDKGQAAQSAVDELENAVNDLEMLVDELRGSRWGDIESALETSKE